MSVVWMKTKFDPALNMEIPHSPNFAQAMYGFRELGAEIVPYHELGDIDGRVSREDIVLDYVDPCREILHQFGADPQLENYPEVLRKFLGRKIWRDTIDSISRHEDKWSAGYFVKPVRQKAFTGKTISSIRDLEGCGNSTENYEVLVSEPISIAAEWRCFLYYDEILDVRPYGQIADPHAKTFLYHYDSSVLLEMQKAFRRWDGRPAACSMDICVTDDGRTLLVECNDAYALGCYGLYPLYYAKLISARWSQLLGREDEYDFRRG